MESKPKTEICGDERHGNPGANIGERLRFSPFNFLSGVSNMHTLLHQYDTLQEGLSFVSSVMTDRFSLSRGAARATNSLSSSSVRITLAESHGMIRKRSEGMCRVPHPSGDSA